MPSTAAFSAFSEDDYEDTVGAGSGVAERDLNQRLKAAAQTVKQRESMSIEARVQAASAALDHNHTQQQLSRAELEIMAERDRGSAELPHSEAVSSGRVNGLHQVRFQIIRNART